MLRKWLDYQLSLTAEGKPLHRMRSLISAGDTFLFEAPINTSNAPHIRDAIDLKRWMFIVVLSLFPCIFAAIWNTGLQSLVYSSGDPKLMNEYLLSTTSLSAYLDFAMKENRYFSILWEGLSIFLPLTLLVYLVGGICEALFALVRGHEISEGFLVTGILYVLILPPTIPYWMAALGIILGVVLGKEVFGGTGMNIVNPALAARCFLFFTFPGRMSGEVWVGKDSLEVRQSLLKMNQMAKTNPLDGYTQATKLNQYNVPFEVKRAHIDAIATNNLGSGVESYPILQKQFEHWKELGGHQGALGDLTQEQIRQFVTTPLNEGGLALSSGYYPDAYHFSALNYGIGHNTDFAFFLGDKLGSLGETSILAILIGAAILIWTGVGSWRTMTAMIGGAFVTASLFEYGTKLFGVDGGAWAPAQFTFPAYKHLLLGGLAFGAVFMATDPVSSPSTRLGKWIFGIFCGVVTIVIRVINPAYPEGVMLSILMGNVFVPLIDYYVAKGYRRKIGLRKADRAISS